MYKRMLNQYLKMYYVRELIHLKIVYIRNMDTEYIFYESPYFCFNLII